MQKESFSEKVFFINLKMNSELCRHTTEFLLLSVCELDVGITVCVSVALTEKPKIIIAFTGKTSNIRLNSRFALLKFSVLSRAVFSLRNYTSAQYCISRGRRCPKPAKILTIVLRLRTDCTRYAKGAVQSNHIFSYFQRS